MKKNHKISGINNLIISNQLFRVPKLTTPLPKLVQVAFFQDFSKFFFLEIY